MTPESKKLEAAIGALVPFGLPYVRFYLAAMRFLTERNAALS